MGRGGRGGRGGVTQKPNLTAAAATKTRITERNSTIEIPLRRPTDRPTDFYGMAYDLLLLWKIEDLAGCWVVDFFFFFRVRPNRRFGLGGRLVRGDGGLYQPPSPYQGIEVFSREGARTCQCQCQSLCIKHRTQTPKEKKIYIRCTMNEYPHRTLSSLD